MLFDSSAQRELARAFGATLVVILTIVITMMLIRTVGMAAGGSIAPEDVVLLLGYLSLGYLPMMMSLSLFVAVVISLGRMYRDSEMVIWFSTGVGLGRFVKPVLRMAWPVLLVVALLLLLVWPWGNRSSAELRSRYEQRSDLSRVAPGVFQSSRDGSRVFFVDRASQADADAHQVFILTQHEDGESVTSAKSGRLERDGDERRLVLQQGQRNAVDTHDGSRTLASFDNYSIVVDERAAREAQTRPPSAMTTLELVLDPQPRHLGELAWRLGMMAASANLLLLGIGLSAAHPRRPTNWNLLFALFAFVAYFNLVNLSQVWIATGRYAFGPMMAALHGGVFAIAMALIWWRDHAAVLRPPGRPKPP